MMRSLFFIADCVANAVIVLGIPLAMALDLFHDLTGWMRR
jgi:hypothetical protein